MFIVHAQSFFFGDEDEDKEGNRTQLISAFSWNLLNYFRDFSSTMYNLVLKNIMAKKIEKILNLNF